MEIQVIFGNTRQNIGELVHDEVLSKHEDHVQISITFEQNNNNNNNNTLSWLCVGLYNFTGVWQRLEDSWKSGCQLRSVFGEKILHQWNKMETDKAEHSTSSYGLQRKKNICEV
ncbi:hypothetical protein APTSU1_001464900 [Apodemus speciosus]|uniref:Uncharacterized protein n=1 Tax=Apodemus speciosus TaxID=105296 RepID=A0ABQ0FJK0_APOSI